MIATLPSGVPVIIHHHLRKSLKYKHTKQKNKLLTETTGLPSFQLCHSKKTQQICTTVKTAAWIYEDLELALMQSNQLWQC